MRSRLVGLSSIAKIRAIPLLRDYHRKRTPLAVLAVGRVGLVNDLLWLIAVQPPRALVPQENLALEVFADQRIFGGRFEDVGHEIHGLLDSANDRAVKEFSCHSSPWRGRSPAGDSERYRLYPGARR